MTRATASGAFALLVARWRLTQSEVARLLGLQPGGAWIHPAELDAASEGCLGEILQLEVALSEAFGDTAGMPRWLRTPSASLGGASPLSAMADADRRSAIMDVVLARRDA